MDGLEIAFTKACKSYKDTGEELKQLSAILFSQVDTIELGLWLMKTICDASDNTDMMLHEYIAEQLKEKFILIDKPEIIHPDDCTCDHQE